MSANWETPDWDCLPDGGWWQVVHHPMVYAMVRPIEPLLPHNSGYNIRNLERLCQESGRDVHSLCQIHVVGEVLAIRERFWDAEQQCFWLRLRDEGDFGEQWLRKDGTSLGLGTILEALPSKRPSAMLQQTHRRALREVRSVRTALDHARGKEGKGLTTPWQPWHEVPRLSLADAQLGAQVNCGINGEEWARALGWLKIAPGDDDGPLIQQLLSEGVLVVEHAFPPDFAEQFLEEVSELDNGWNLHPAPQLTPGQRGDRIVWIDEDLAAVRYGARCVASGIASLKALAHVLNPAVSRLHRACAAAGDPLHVLLPKDPASEDAVLTVSPKAQLASYSHGGGYICHQDNRFRPSHGTRLNSRELTAILYANPTDWDLQGDGGALRIYLGSEQLESAPPPEHPNMEVKPTVGTLVVFFSRLWHEVLPSERLRRALTLWILRPEEEDSWIPTAF